MRSRAKNHTNIARFCLESRLHVLLRERSFQNMRQATVFLCFETFEFLTNGRVLTAVVKWLGYEVRIESCQLLFARGRYKLSFFLGIMAYSLLLTISALKQCINY